MSLEARLRLSSAPGAKLPCARGLEKLGKRKMANSGIQKASTCPCSCEIKRPARLSRRKSSRPWLRKLKNKTIMMTGRREGIEILNEVGVIKTVIGTEIVGA